MSKAKDLAKESYPDWEMTGVPNFDGQEESMVRVQRVAYVEGYHQAEKELIDKAVGWIKEINNHHHIMRYSDSCEPPLSELIEWFKNYMKEESINSK